MAMNSPPVHQSNDQLNEPIKFKLSGRVTVSVAEDIHHRAMQYLADKKPIVIDVSHAEYLDVSAIQIIMALGRDLTRHKVDCDIKGLDGPAIQSFRMCGMVEC